MSKAPFQLTHMDTRVRFWHENDERAFFEWLARIPCVEKYQRITNAGLVVTLKRKPKRDDLRELLGLCHRWGVDMRQLAAFETARNRGWFRNPDAFWHKSVFGNQSDVPSNIRALE